MILPTRQIDPKHDELLLFMIADVTGYKEALAAAINFDSDPIPTHDSDPNPHLVSAVSSTPTPIPLEYAEFANVFEDKEIPQLPPH